MITEYVDFGKFFSRYSNSVECELDELAKLGYEPRQIDRMNIEYVCRKYD